MAKDTITVQIERTINLGNYSNIKLIVGETRTVANDESLQEQRLELMEELMEQIDDFVNENDPDE